MKMNMKISDSMKRIILTAFCAILPLMASAQGQIKTKSFIVSDFREKTMKVVLTGNEMLDASLKDNLLKVWNISPYETCSMEEFERTKSDPNLYFMAICDSKFFREASAGIKMIAVFKGSAEATEGFDGMYKVVRMPFCSSEDPDGRELVFLPALLTIVQTEVERIMDRSINIGSDVTVKPKNVIKTWKQQIDISKSDLGFTPGASLSAIYKHDNLYLHDDDTPERLLTAKEHGHLIGYVVAPTVPVKGSHSYTMLIDSSNWELFYITRHKLSGNGAKGFSQVELRAFIAHTSKASDSKKD